MPADPRFRGDLTKRKILIDDSFIDLSLMLRQQLSVKIIQQSLFYNFLHGSAPVRYSVLF